MPSLRATSTTSTAATHLLVHLPEEHPEPGVQAGVQPARVPSMHSPSSPTATISNVLRHVQEEHPEPGVQARVRRARVPTVLRTCGATWWISATSSHQLPRRGKGTGSQLKRSNSGQQSAEFCWQQEQVCPKAEERASEQPGEDFKQETGGQPGAEVEEVDELGHALCRRRDQEPVEGQAEDPRLVCGTTLISSSHCT